MLLATWKGRGKRIKKAKAGRVLVLHGMRFKVRERKRLTDLFIQKEFLNEKEIYEAVRLSLWTDYGLYIELKGDHAFKDGPMSDEARERQREMEMTDDDRALMAEQKKRDRIAEYMSLVSGKKVKAKSVFKKGKKKDD